ncbi:MULTISPECIES: metal-sensitive transcriptional regulator [Bacillales]|uniref:metal-sensitive transcriptional regulator n=1 Tax=Bacillales TaxID=1385 RepID=UPI0018831D01|nr:MULTISPECIES: metal-sensitive transcriptional regulator [Bacillaceae]MBF0705739.1 metal-sensitive transcriptional regulator [Pseudalkalibacillus hwajinpoensis]MCA0991714.1 metal-sensitive transcriptional regulator [Pseudalkalibacillus hwajinpoensis]MDO6657949.1 metal-sensitive transcriptional regulator [Anaerobacillus sp. 1_MG-2023]WLR61211.1 metal-sensitive transcriptional regulator [Pseudalkalibacillus hwajinpoensis]
MQYDKAVMNRLKRIEGQIRGVIQMMEQEKSCEDIVNQLSATRSGIDRSIGLIVSSNLEQCLHQQIEQGESTDDVVKEAVNLLVRSR